MLYGILISMSTHTHHNPLGTESINKLILQFSLPAIVGMVINALYNIVDRIYIGNTADLGANGLAGITLGFPLMLIQLAIGVLFGIGGATLFSMRLGQKKPEEAKKVLSSAFILLVTSALIYTVVGLVFLEPLLRLFGASDAVLPYSLEYMRVIFIGTVFQVVGLGLNHFVRADGSPKIAMYTMFLGAGTNILLDPLFIYGFGWGMFGAAFATIIAQAFAATWVLLYFTGKKSKVHLDLKHLVLDNALVKQIVSLGLPSFLLQLAGSLLNSLLNRNLTLYGGDLAISGMGIINSIQTFMFMPIIGLNQGVQPIISFNFGAQNFDRVKKAVKLAIIYATGIASLGYLVTRFFPSQLVSVFNQDPQLLAFGKNALTVWTLAFFLVGFQVIASTFFQAIGRSKMAMFLTLTRQVILLIPAILLFPILWGLNGLLYAAPFSDVLAAALTGFFFLKVYKELTHLKPVHENINLPEEGLEITV